MGIKVKHRPYATIAWQFLDRAGYINFGVAPKIVARALAQPRTQGSVIVIGAGLAGAALEKYREDWISAIF